MTVHQATQQQAMRMVQSDPAGSDQQHAHNSTAMTHEHEINMMAMAEVETNIQV